MMSLVKLTRREFKFMKRKIIISLIIFQVCFNSCSNKCTDTNERDIMGHWYKRKLLLPGGWELLDSGAVKPKLLINIDSPNAKFYVLHYFMADCDKCVNELLRAQTFIEKNQNKFPNVKFVFVATGPTSYYIKEAIKKANFEFPLYF